MKYRKKSVVVEAIQWTGNNYDEICKFTNINLKTANVDNDKFLLIPTLEGTMSAKVSDYIIRGLLGEYYPCKLDIFEKTYDLVDEETPKIPTNDWLIRGISPEQLEQEKIEAIHESVYKLGKAEAYKELVEKLKEKAYTYSDITGYQSTVVDVNEIDGVYEELVSTHDVTEVAYKNEYSRGMEDFARELMLIPSNTVRKDEIRNLLREKKGEMQ